MPRAMDGGLKNSDVYLQVFGEKGFARKVGEGREGERQNWITVTYAE